VSGSTSPLTPKPAPEALAAETTALVPPLFVRVTVWLWLLPTVTLPKLTVAGLSISWPAAVPAPETVTAAVVGVEGSPACPGDSLSTSEAWPCMETLPDIWPADFGANTKLKDVVWPGERVTGNVSPVKLKAAFVADAWAMVTLESPEFVNVAVFA